jgi:hypothetical protein
MSDGQTKNQTSVTCSNHSRMSRMEQYTMLFPTQYHVERIQGNTKIRRDRRGNLPLPPCRPVLTMQIMRAPANLPMISQHGCKMKGGIVPTSVSVEVMMFMIFIGWFCDCVRRGNHESKVWQPPLAAFVMPALSRWRRVSHYTMKYWLHHYYYTTTMLLLLIRKRPMRMFLFLGL